MAERLRRKVAVIKNSMDATRFATEASLSLFVDAPTNPVEHRKPLYEKLSLVPAREPMNRELDLYTNFLSVLKNRQITVPVQNRNSYWMQNVPYSVMEVVGTCAQFTDHHGAPLPKTTFPPSKDVATFINNVLKETNPTTVDRQFDLLLDITNNHVIGAANLGMVATRYISRFGDFRAYPQLKIAGKEYTKEASDEELGVILSQWSDKVARFEIHNTFGKNDGIGDGYYFWTHMFAAMALGTKGMQAKTMQKLVGQGTELMIWAKYKVAGRKGDILPHFEASRLGRSIGLLLIAGEK